MKNIVIYKSSTGFTKRYAMWIAEKLSCEAIAQKEAGKQNLSEYDYIIFGGWIMGGMISGLEKIKKLQIKKLVVFAVGATPMKLINVQTMKEKNKLQTEKLFYFPGGMEYSKLNFAVKGMLKMIKKSLIKNNDQTEQGKYMAEMLGKNFDISDSACIEELINFVVNK